MRVLRQRQRAGMILLAVQVPEAELVEALVEAHLLRPELADEREQIERAVEKLLGVLIAEQA